MSGSDSTSPRSSSGAAAWLDAGGASERKAAAAKVSVYNHTYYVANRERLLQKHAEWRANNKERIKALNRAYRTRRKVVGEVPPAPEDQS